VESRIIRSDNVVTLSLDVGSRDPWDLLPPERTIPQLRQEWPNCSPNLPLALRLNPVGVASSASLISGAD
jgi:hypothetical protein